MAREKTKKPFYKKWWVWLIAIVILIGIFGGGEEDTEQADSTTNQTETASTDTEAKDTSESPSKTESEAKDEPKEEPKEEPKKVDDGKIDSGTYKVGTDLDAGEYLVIASGMGYIENSKDSTGSLESIIFNENLTDGYHSFVTLNDGEYFKLQGAEMYPIDKAPSVVPEDGLYENGMYRVGKDIPAGEYKVVLDSAIGMGYLEVNSSSRHSLDTIVTNENVQADMYITVKDGQYLTLQDLKIQK